MCCIHYVGLYGDWEMGEICKQAVSKASKFHESGGSSLYSSKSVLLFVLLFFFLKFAKGCVSMLWFKMSTSLFQMTFLNCFFSVALMLYAGYIFIYMYTNERMPSANLNAACCEREIHITCHAQAARTSVKASSPAAGQVCSTDQVRHSKSGAKTTRGLSESRK